MSVVEKLRGKKILIWGYGREGKSTEDFLKRDCEPACVDIFEGKREEIDEAAYDLIIKSPGIPMDEDNEKYTSQTDLFLEEYRDQVIGITGTKGKSTTSALTYHILNEIYTGKAIFLGNIGEPCLNYFDEIDDDTIVVFEMSCHQLAHLKISPHIAVFLNIYEEHLDYYKTFDKYFAAKKNIAKTQREGDFYLVGEQLSDYAKEETANTKAKLTVVSASDVPDYKLSILGDHNKYNADFAIRIASDIIGLDRDKCIASAESFSGLPHRLQYAGNVGGIDFYDDSISTIPGATIQALESVPNSYSVLIGGMDRGIDYTELISYIKEHAEYKYICAYESGKRIYDQVKELDYVHFCDDLEKAVAYAKEITPAGKACILSPASASYGYFKNFEERGEVFKQLVGV